MGVASSFSSVPDLVDYSRDRNVTLIEGISRALTGPSI